MPVSKSRRAWLFVALLALAGSAAARTVVDYELPEDVHGTPAAAHLTLMGTGIVERSYLPFYAVALYRDASNATLDRPANAMQPLRIAIIWLAPKLDEAAMAAYWTSAFRERAVEPTQPKRLAGAVAKLAAAVGPVERGDLVTFDYNPESGLHVGRDGRLVAQLPGLEFNRVFLSIWLGDKAPKDLRTDLLREAPREPVLSPAPAPTASQR